MESGKCADFLWVRIVKKLKRNLLVRKPSYITDILWALSLTFTRMFENNPSFSADIQKWNVSAARSMERMFYNSTAFGKAKVLEQTITEQSPETANSEFKLLCWDLPNAQVKVQNMLCGSAVRFDPCCASQTQAETSCCNRFCYNISTTCAHPEHDKGKADHYSASSGTMDRNPALDNTIYFGDGSNNKQDYEGHMRGNHINQHDTRALTKPGTGAIVGVVLLLLVVVLCLCCLVYYI